MTYIRANRIGHDIIYSVYNSLGSLMLYTRNRPWAESIARAFEQDPDTVEVVVCEQDPGIPKRL